MNQVTLKSSPSFPISIISRSTIQHITGCPHIRPLQPKLDSEFEDLHAFTALVDIQVISSSLLVKVQHLRHASKFTYLVGLWVQMYAKAAEKLDLEPYAALQWPETRLLEHQSATQVPRQPGKVRMVLYDAASPDIFLQAGIIKLEAKSQFSITIHARDPHADILKHSLATGNFASPEVVRDSDLMFSMLQQIIDSTEAHWAGKESIESSASVFMMAASPSQMSLQRTMSSKSSPLAAPSPSTDSHRTSYPLSSGQATAVKSTFRWEMKHQCSWWQ